ncbi:hypothetical protein [Halioglobus japonicus]|uniref:hypothetical protein n=1 Tax=Halioglobus japonicus TaxID=930805 RepID=UPI0012F48B0D|nr:hypothetical protein [Halioglobus japonicus]
MSDENNSTTGNKADEVAPADTGKDEAAASEQGDTPGKQGSPLVEKSAASATPLRRW